MPHRVGTADVEAFLYQRRHQLTATGAMAPGTDERFSRLAPGVCGTDAPEWKRVNRVKRKDAEWRNPVLSEVLVLVVAPDHDEVRVERVRARHGRHEDLQLHDGDAPKRPSRLGARPTPVASAVASWPGRRRLAAVAGCPAPAQKSPPSFRRIRPTEASGLLPAREFRPSYLLLRRHQSRSPAEAAAPVCEACRGRFACDTQCPHAGTHSKILALVRKGTIHGS